MNERIKELAERVDKEFDNPGARYKAIEKFAELIVRECLTVITPTEHDTGSYVDFSNGLKLAQVRIKKHFGVKE